MLEPTGGIFIKYGFVTVICSCLKLVFFFTVEDNGTRPGRGEMGHELASLVAASRPPPGQVLVTCAVIDDRSVKMSVIAYI